MTIIEDTPRTTSRAKRWAVRALATVAIAGLAAVAVPAAANAVPGAQLVAGGPTLSISPTVAPLHNITAGSSYTISGSGYNSTTAQGVYVSFGWVNASSWRPSAAAPSGNRVTTQTVWVRPGAVPAGSTTEAAWTTTGSSSASFSFTFTPNAPAANPSGNNTFYVYSVNGHNVANASNEQAREVSFTGTKSTTPAPAAGTGTLFATSSGSTVTVTGTGYTAAPATGIYVSVGTLNNSGWKPSAGFASSTRTAADTVWTYGAGPSVQASGQAKLDSTGAFSITLNKALLPASAGTGKHFAVYSVGAHGIVSAGSEAEIAVP